MASGEGSTQILSTSDVKEMQISNYIQVTTEFAFNILMIIYLIQPYRRASSVREPTTAVKAISGRDTVYEKLQY